MKFSLAAFCFFGPFLYVFAQCSNSVSEFQLDGDYLIGGLFEIHHVNTPVQQNRPETIICSSFPFSSPNYRRFQLMRFAVEEINNLTNLLPNVYLGYELFDHCSDIQSFPGIFDLISVKQMMQSWVKPQTNNASVSKIIAVVGPFTSTQALTIAPLFMADFIPMMNYGSASSTFSSKERFPSFLRTVHPNKDVLEVIVNILLYFNWRWVAFLYDSNLYGNDGLDFFSQRITGTEICLGYSKSLGDITTYYQMFQELEIHGINAVVVLSSTDTAEDLIMSAIQLNITKKVWITGDGWSLNSMLPKMKGIENIGTLLGVSQPLVTIPGFSDFVYSTKRMTYYENLEKQRLCSQFCLSDLTAEEILDSDPTYSFPVYSAVYAIAHALHNVLKCNADGCNCNITVYPHMVLAELKKSNFTLLNHSIEFDENGDPEFGSYSIVYWNRSRIAEEIGFAHFQPSWNFFINRSKIQWNTDGEVPTSLCSRECPEGSRMIKDGVHKCCFTCEICPKGTYFNITEDEYNCKNCKDTEWSAEGSTTCNPRSVEYIPFTDGGAIVIMVGSIALDGLIFSMSVLFTINYNTPVVKSAGGPMCFLTLGCLSLCSLSVFFYFGKPTNFSCIMRFLPFLLFYTVCLACFVVRSFQIVCIFKMAANFPKLYNWWMKYHGQWLVITMAFVTQTILLLICYVSATPKPYNDINWSPEEIILSCDTTIEAFSGSAAFLVFLGSLCFIFSYLGKDLPKNYNEAKAITFCLLLLIFTWIIFATVLVLYQGKYIHTINALAVLASLYSFLLWYFFPKCYIIVSQPHKNTQQYFQGLIQNYTKTISQ